MSRPTPIVLVVATALTLVSAMAHTALAAKNDSEKQARRSFERAEAHFNAGLFAEALAEYQDGYEHLPLPGFLINIAQCQRRLGDLAQARATYHKFILVAPDSPYVPEVKELIAELDRLLDAAEGSPAPQASGPPGTKPASEAQPRTPSSTSSLPTPAAETTNPLLVEQSSPPEPVAAKSRWWLWTGLSAVAIIAAGAVVYALAPPGTSTAHDGSLGTLRR
jgi:tetratricopeptide (TPR) repeat protein